MRFTKILLAFFILSCSAALAQSTVRESNRLVKRDSSDVPNVVLIMLEEVGYCDLSCYGNRIVRTPNITSLYENSIRMANYHCSPVGTQTAAAILTGRYPERMGVWRDAAGRNVLRFGEYTLADMMREGGYRTAIFGKWNLGSGDFYAPEFRGFDESLVVTANGLSQIPDFWGNTDDSPVLRHNGKLVRTRGNMTRTFFESAAKFASQKQKEKPFFVFMPLTLCAQPYRPTEKHLDEIIAAGLEQETARYYALLRDFDDSLGAFIKNLQKNGLLANTVIIFTSATGSPHAAFNKEFSGGKGSLREGGHRVPFFIFWQREFKQYRGTDIQRLVMHADVAPTILDICSLKTDRKLLTRQDGVSFRPLLLSGGEAWFPRTLYMQPREVESFQTPSGSLVMTERFRLLDGRQLFDMEEDLRQMKDVSGAHASELKTLEKLYKKWFQEAVVEEGRVVNPIYIACGLTPAEKLAVQRAVQAEALQREKVPEAEQTREIMHKALATARASAAVTEKKPTQAAVLTCYDWRQNDPLVYPAQLAQLPADTGTWETEFLEAGTYEFTLRITPENVRRVIPATQAFLQIGKKTPSAPVPRDAAEVKIRTPVPAGAVPVRAMFQGTGGSFGAYFVVVRKVE